MSYRLEADEALVDGLLRALLEEFDGALDELAEPQVAAFDEAVHEARKSLKRARTVLRLLRTVLGDDRFLTANGLLREAGRVLSATRDAAVLVATLDGLPRSGMESFSGLREQLAHELAEARQHTATSTLDDARMLIRTVRTDVAEWALGTVPDERVLAGVERIYRRGRRRSAAARAAPSAEALHEWRKRVKDLGYTLQLVEPAWPEALDPLAGEAKRLWDLLGDDHDLHLLAVAAVDRAGTFPSPGDLARLTELVAAERGALQRAAFELGARLYAERPSAFIRRLRSYLDTWMLRAPVVQA